MMEKLLRDSTRLLDIKLTDIEVPFQLTPEMKEAIEEAQEQIKNGDFLTHSEVNKEIEKWLEE